MKSGGLEVAVVGRMQQADPRLTVGTRQPTPAVT